MKYVIYFILMLVSATYLSSCAPYVVPVKFSSSPRFNPQVHNKVVVLTEKDKNLPNRFVETEFIKLLLAKGYSVSSRSDVESIMKELKFQHSGLTDSDATKIGKMLNVPIVIIVTLNNYERDGDSRSVSLGARMIDVETAEMLWIGSASMGSYMNEHPIWVKLSQALANKIPNATKSYELAPEYYLSTKESVSLKSKTEQSNKIVVFSMFKDQGTQRLVEDECVGIFMENKYRVISRSDVESIIKELDLQYSGLTDKDAAKIGKMLNVPVVCIITPEFNYTIGVSCNSSSGWCKAYYLRVGLRLIDVEKNEILWIGSCGDAANREDELGKTALNNTSALMNALCKDLETLKHPNEQQ